MYNQLEYDILIIGSGAAGLSLALKLADHSKVAVLSKEALIEDGNLNPTNKVVIEYLIQISNILYEHNAISKEDRDLFTSTSMKSIQNTISKGLKKLEKFSK